MKENIVFLANAASIHTERWAVHLSKSYSITILSFEDAQIDGVEIISLRSPIKSLLRYIWVVPSVRRILAKLRPKILHAHYAGGYGLIGMMCGFHPYVLSVWGSDIYQAPKNSVVRKWILKCILNQADYLCSTSVAMANEAKKYVNRDFLITPFGIDCNIYRPFEVASSSEEFVIGTVKKLDKLYGLDRLLNAFAILCEQKPQVRLRLLIVGDGEERASLTALANNLGISSFVEFYGTARQENVPALLNKMMVFVALSRSESFGVAVLEASACKLPVVVSDAGGLPEVVAEGVTGFVVKDGDPRLAAIAIKKLMADSVLREQMGTAGQEFVRSRYQWEHTAKEMEYLYTRINMSCADQCDQ